MRTPTHAAHGLHRGLRLSAAACMAGLSTGVVAVALVTVPASASVTTLYAAAAGTGTLCTRVSPCTLTTALSTVVAGGTIELVTPGTSALYIGGFTVATASTSPISSVTIKPAPGVTNPTLDGGSTQTVLTVNSGVNLNISGVTIQNGGNASAGGGVNNLGALTVTDSTVTDNGAYNGYSNSGNGGGIFSSGNLALTDSTVSDNLSSSGDGVYSTGTAIISDSTISNNSDESFGPAGSGSGIYSSGTLIISGSTVSGNYARDSGGGIENDGGTATVDSSTIATNRVVWGSGGGIDSTGHLTVTNSTVSGNSVANFGSGGISNEGYLVVTGSTVSGNESFSGGSGIDNGGSAILVGTIVANTGNGPDCVGDSMPPITDGGYNIDDDGSCGFSTTGSISDSTTLDASLGALGNNGGPTQTILPTPTGPAVGVIPMGTVLNGVQVCPRTDQRGLASVGNCTIGAVEVDVCATGLHAQVLTATYATGTFTGVFCLNAKGVGSYTQGGVSGAGTVLVMKGVTVIAALGKNLALAGSTNGTKSGFVELAPVPTLGTFTLT